MRRLTWWALVAVGLLGLASSPSAWAQGGVPLPAPAYGAPCWHAPYYHTAYGMPVALVVPPTAGRQVHWSWGVGGSYVTPIGAQYQLATPQPGGFGPAPMSATPYWPTNTDQFGVYYVRGPW